MESAVSYTTRIKHVFGFIRLWWFITMLARYPCFATGGIVIQYRSILWYNNFVGYIVFKILLLLISNNLSENRVNPNPVGRRPHTLPLPSNTHNAPPTSFKCCKKSRTSHKMLTFRAVEHLKKSLESGKTQ